ncbi:hypothetical protein BSL78_07154 [Apostichopus japonicus]|uniref:Integrase catalytic domain-containing protein n=1 Tax=Stichopus japonicus TaxID=307972 RepID=A0A2G8L6P1_STIJA|nr:hypothetical protein BSL78_07154 [Apostichopus japonicus]
MIIVADLRLEHSTLQELERAEMYWIQEALKSIHDQIKRGECKTLSPFEEKGIIHVGGRVEKRLLSYDCRHPIQHPISMLSTRQTHEIGHDGVATTAAKVGRKYWIIGVQKLAKTVKHRCVLCKKMLCKNYAVHKTESQFMADLPKYRLMPEIPPFYYTASDYFGPFSVKVGRNKTSKHYGVIFTCLNTRTVHLDLATDASTMEFIQVLRRFLAYRGCPKVITSDNGKQFVGAQKELQEMIKEYDETQLQEFCADKGVEWKFATSLAPHQNGCVEPLVKSCKLPICLISVQLEDCLMTLTTDHIFVLTICYWDEREPQFHKVLSEKPRTRSIQWNLYEESLMRSGNVGIVTYFHCWFLARNGTPTDEAFGSMIL